MPSQKTSVEIHTLWPSSEVFGQAEILTRFAGVDPNDIKGMRAPFLAIGGDKMFGALNKNGFTYDSSMPLWSVSGNYGRKDTVPSWPYTLDYAMHHSCTIKPCPQVWSLIQPLLFAFYLTLHIFQNGPSDLNKNGTQINVTFSGPDFHGLSCGVFRAYCDHRVSYGRLWPRSFLLS